MPCKVRQQDFYHVIQCVQWVENGWKSGRAHSAMNMIVKSEYQYGPKKVMEAAIYMAIVIK